ncbi:terpene synthase family protein [Streptomyces sp. NPDC056987]|uniref:terpene synthase family protein n=1 Tax=Streptomyces sp. NPDC056987 TaxID=3345988 RepID=UPI0036454ABF
MPDAADGWSALLRGITIGIPFPTACHPGVVEAEARGRRWAERHGLVNSDKARSRLHGGRLGQLAGRANGMRLALLAAPVRNYRRAGAQPLTLSEYEVIRRCLGACPPCFALIYAANGDVLLAAEYGYPEVQQPALHANNVVCWNNDIYSLGTERRQPGRFWNMPLVYAAYGRTPASVRGHARSRVRRQHQAGPAPLFRRTGPSPRRPAARQPTGSPPRSAPRTRPRTASGRT